MAERSGRWAWVFDAITMVTVLVGLTFGAFELRELRSAQESQALLQLYQTVQTPEYVEGAQLIWDLPDDLTADELFALEATPEGLLMQRVTITFEALGLMVYRGDVSLEWVDELFRQMAIMSWEKFEAYTLQSREDAGYDGIMEWHQWLVERLRERADGEDPAPAYEAYRDWQDPNG